MKEIKASIITIGDELLIGQVLDTNSGWMAQRLNEIGVWVNRRIAIADEARDIYKTLEEESKKSDIILITGGLGPTDDDKTKAVLCDYFDGRLVLDQTVLKQVEKCVSQKGAHLLDRNRNQAMVPDKCDVLFNERGTAPGLWFEKEGKVYAAMPGIPYEMEGLMESRVCPKILKSFKLPTILHRTVLVAGISESALAQKLYFFEQSLPPHIHLAYLPGAGIMKLRLTAKGERAQKVSHQLDQYGTALKIEIKDKLVASKDGPLAQGVGEKLIQKKLSVATAESCTGGYIGHLLTSIPGSSAYFEGGIIAYSNKIKNQALGVKKNTLQEKGAVSEEVVKEMLSGVLEKMSTEVGVAVSGIMGPAGGTEEKPVGTVWIAAGSREKVTTRKLVLKFNREKNIERTGNYALLLLLEVLKEIEK